MAFKWTEGDHVTSNIVDATEQNASFNNLKGEMNGGLDRENLPNESVSNDELHQSAFVKYAVQTGVRLQDSLFPATATWLDAGGANAINEQIRCLNYNSYTGGWRTNNASKINTLFQEGMLHLEYSGWYWLRNHVATNQATRDPLPLVGWCQFQITVDGNPVLTSPRLYNNVGQVSIIGDVPVATGNHDIAIRWRFSPWPGNFPSGGTILARPIFYYDGGQITVVNRYR
jgi:hypothetical protein